jgi:hypothetical protein
VEPVLAAGGVAGEPGKNWTVAGRGGEAYELKDSRLRSGIFGIYKIGINVVV